MTPWIQIAIAITVAVILFGCEILLPGGILGAIGGVLMVIATIIAYQHDGPLAAILVALGSGVFVLAFLYFQFRVLPNTGLGKKLFLQTTISGKSVDEPADTLLGAKGFALAQLTPSGLVKIDGTHYEAIAETGFIEKGSEVEVVAKDAFRLVVRK